MKNNIDMKTINSTRKRVRRGTRKEKIKTRGSVRRKKGSPVRRQRKKTRMKMRTDSPGRSSTGWTDLGKAAKFAEALLYLLLTRCLGRAFGIARVAPKHNGLEAWELIRQAKRVGVSTRAVELVERPGYQSLVAQVY